MRTPNEIVAEALAAIHGCADLQALEQVKASYLGKSGQLTELLKSLGGMPAEERKTAGARINEAKQAVEATLKDKREALQQAELDRQLAAETLDVTLPGRGPARGGLHPVSKTLSRIQALFHSIGFEVATGPEIETDFYNFTALNIPEDHPARAMHDTFYLQGGELLRTHTSPVQVRFMQKHQPPLRIIAPGRVYRCDSDVTHTPMFTRSKACGWTSRSPSPTSRACWPTSCATSSSATTCRCASAPRSSPSPNPRPKWTSAA